MVRKTKQLSNPFSTGGGGGNFETRVQSAFVALMLTGGFAPCLPPWPIKKIKLQGKYAGYDTDDLIVFAAGPDGGKESKLLGQIKHSIRITEGDRIFGEVIQAAWSDFINPSIFTEGQDKLALITGPLSDTDTNDARTILEWARHSDDAQDFLVKVNQSNFSSNAKRNKLYVFRVHLNSSNGSKPISDDELWRFLKSFHLLGYDLDIKAGVTLSLLQSLISQFSPENTQALWTQLVDEVQAANQNAGTISVDTLPKELLSSFQRKVVDTIPADFAKTTSVPAIADLSKITYASDLVVAVLLGAWDENNDGDKTIAEQLVNGDFAGWMVKIRETLYLPESPLILTNGKWSIAKRLEMWNMLGPRFFDDQLDRFKQFAVSVLKEPDPMYDLAPEERYAASIHGKVLKRSHILRKGLGETLALLGSHPKALTNCSLNKPETIAAVAVREILKDADWVLWASLNNQLPSFAEAAPEQFLAAVETALQGEPCPFKTLFAQEGKGISGSNYMTGLLWALETLAWDELYLSRVTVLLGELASIDPGGTWANRPANSLTTIFLPWMPLTMASIEKRKVAIQTLQKELPEIAWKVLLSLLPNQHQVSVGSHKPVWRGTIPEDRSKGVTHQEYWEQVSFYADLAVVAAQGDFNKLTTLSEHLDNLPQPAFDKLLSYFASDDIIGKQDDERYPLWTTLVNFVSKHKKYAGAEWAMLPDLVEKIEGIATSIAPKSPLSLHRRLFTGRDIDLYEINGDWEEQQKKLNEHRQNAIKEIIIKYGLETVIEFAVSVESAWHVGLSLGLVAEDNAESIILPKLLETENRKLVQLTSGFVWGRYQNQGLLWVDRIDTTGWSVAQIGIFLAYLAFTESTWKRSERLLGKNEAAYWTKASVNPYHAEGDLNLAIDKLVEYGRANAAISCLYRLLHDKQELDHARTVKTLMAALSATESADTMDVFYTIELIKALQNDSSTNPDDLFKIEWAYLPLLDRHQNASPKLLEQRLASDPNFFCEVIRLIYRSKIEHKSEKEHTEQQKAIASNAYRLLYDWRIPPGMQLDGVFSGDKFKQWLVTVKKECSESGHLEVALTHVGNVLIHCPPDPSGLWIHHTAAGALNAKDADEIRRGYRTGIYNSRGVHWVDPEGKPEVELASKYRQQADEAENKGYHRLAATLRGLADSYNRDADRIVVEHKHDNS